MIDDPGGDLTFSPNSLFAMFDFVGTEVCTDLHCSFFPFSQTD